LRALTLSIPRESGANPRARLAGVALALSLAAPGAAKAGEPPLPPPRPPEFLAAPQSETPAPAAEASPAGAAPACLARLLVGGASAESATTPAAIAEGCGVEAPVRLMSITLLSGDVVRLSGEPLVDCAFAAALTDYLRLIVAPLAEGMLHAKVAAIETGPGYQCRTRDHLPGAKISAHAKGLAVDLMAVDLADKRRIPVARQASADETAYFRAIRSAACGWFTTVLGPGADAFHADNMHLDIEAHGASAGYRICE
jgi:hypothetical protein